MTAAAQEALEQAGREPIPRRPAAPTLPWRNAKSQPTARSLVSVGRPRGEADSHPVTRTGLSGNRHHASGPPGARPTDPGHFTFGMCKRDGLQRAPLVSNTAPLNQPSGGSGGRIKGQRTRASQVWFGHGRHLRPGLLLGLHQRKKLRKCQVTGERVMAQGFTICFMSSQRARQQNFSISAPTDVSMCAGGLPAPGEHPGL